MFGEIRSLVAEGAKGLKKAGELVEELPRNAHGELEDKAIALYLESVLQRAELTRAHIRFKPAALPRRRKRYKAPKYDFITTGSMLSLGEELVEEVEGVYPLDWGGANMSEPSWMLWNDGVLTQGRHRAPHLPRLGGIHEDIREVSELADFDFTRPEQAHLFTHYKETHGKFLRDDILEWQSTVECTQGDVWHVRFAVDDDYDDTFITLVRAANNLALKIWTELNPE